MCEREDEKPTSLAGYFCKHAGFALLKGVPHEN